MSNNVDFKNLESMCFAKCNKISKLTSLYYNVSGTIDKLLRDINNTLCIDPDNEPNIRKRNPYYDNCIKLRDLSESWKRDILQDMQTCMGSSIPEL